MSNTSRKKGEDYKVVGAILLFAVALLWATPTPGQRPYPEPQSSPDPIRVPRPDPLPRSSAGGSVTRGMPPSSIIEITSSIAELVENVKLLRAFDAELMESAKSSISKYEALVNDASDIRRIAIRLLRGLSLPRPAQQSDQRSATTVEQLNAAVAALDTAIQTFLRSAVLKERTIDAELLSKAGVDLEAIIARSVDVQKQAESLATGSNSGMLKPITTVKHTKSKLRSNNLLQLSIECNAWSIEELLTRPAELKARGSLEVGNTEAQTKRYRLVQELVVPVEDCVDAEHDEEAIDKGVRYVAMVKDYTSYEVKGKVFGYQVTYGIGLVNDHKITKRFQQPVSFYYTDEAEAGSFDLLKRPVGLAFMPEWAKELARKH